MWLERDTCLKIEEFTQFAYLKMGEYVDGLDGLGNPKDQEPYKIGREILRELQPLRRELIAEFRSILYPAPLSVFDRRRGHKATEPER